VGTVPRARGVLVAMVIAGLFAGLVTVALAHSGGYAGRGRGAAAQTGPSLGVCRGLGWIAAWEASESDALNSFSDQSLRLILTPTYGGDQIRVRLSNELGAKSVRFSAVTIARQSSGASVVESTITDVRFGGERDVTIGPGHDMTSDPVAWHMTPFVKLAVSVHVDGSSGPATEHYQPNQTSYAAPSDSGDHTDDVSGTVFAKRLSTRPFVTGIDVMAPRTAGTLVTLGDSLTDGARSRVDGDARYPDVLARRLANAPAGTASLAVANAGIGANRIDGDFPFGFGGPAALRRLASDVIHQPGVTDVLVMEGTNDIDLRSRAHGFPMASAAKVISGLSQIVARLHAAKLNVILGTLTPTSNGTIFGDPRSPPTIVRRNAINAWIRTQTIADGIVDFNAALADPLDPDRLRPAYASSDHVHPTNAGYQAMARAVPLNLFRGPRCAR
jgi:lysophospholipase L1-like esterase